MTTAMQIGRLGLDVDLSAPYAWSESGDEIDVSFRIVDNDTAAVRRWLAEQVVNLAGPSRSEAAIPFITTAWPDRDCWVEPLSSSVSPQSSGMQPGESPFDVNLSLRRLPGRKQPRYELGRGPGGGVIGNDHSITTSYQGWCAFPISADAVDLGSDVSWTRAGRTIEGGNLAFITGGSTTLYDTTVSMFLPMEDAYFGAATIEVDVDGAGDWRQIVGRDIRLYDADRVRLTNGSVRWTWNTTTHALEGEVYTTAWEALDESFILTTGGGSFTPLGVDPVSVWVVRNDPLRVTVQFILDYQSGTHRIALFLSLRRGDRNLLGSIKSSSSRQFGITTTETIAATALTGGIRRTDNDANGNRWTMLSPRTFTQDLTEGTLHLTAGAKTFPFGIGIERNGSAATGQNTAANITSQYYAQPPEQLYISAP